MRTNVYIDGFNLYYGALRIGPRSGTSCKRRSAGRPLTVEAPASCWSRSPARYPLRGGFVRGGAPGLGLRFLGEIDRLLERIADGPSPFPKIGRGFASELLTSKRVLPERLLKAGFEFQYPELELELRQALGR
ncbi:MAG: DUF1731 domain-containing protein [Acidobacteria bacterium]|nr:DUF1731 domain-containing protein [Acidobacteriota bacterium]